MSLNFLYQIYAIINKTQILFRKGMNKSIFQVSSLIWEIVQDFRPLMRISRKYFIFIFVGCIRIEINIFLIWNFHTSELECFPSHSALQVLGGDLYEVQGCN